MARLSHGWLNAGLLFLFFQSSFSLVFQEVRAPDVVPPALRTKTSEDLDFSILDLLGRDSIKHLLRSVQCTNNTMSMGFKNDKAYGYIKRGWQWLNDIDPHKLVVVAGAGDCIGRTIAWKEFQDYELTVGNYEPVSRSALAQRDIDETLSFPFDLRLPFSSGKLNTPIDDLSLTWFCADCGTEGSFDFGASISLSPNGVKAILNPRIAVQADISGDIDEEWEIGKIPIGGISIPGGILDVGPQITFSLEYTVGPIQGSAEVETKPVTVDARISGGVSLYVKASVELSAEAPSQGLKAGINLQPYVGGSLMAQATSDEVCPDEGDHYGVKVYPKAGVALNAAVAKANDPEDPLAKAVIASITASLPAYCTGFGGGGSHSDTRQAASLRQV
ncbi:hypothetical protein BDW59DRAFT_172082 [Aspergillus cavernicola]|uniref:Uncharacterized protein n=1 Tax=Aspergillus cavernicola TaxID=176166 RepID=A0ABR4IED3_9EURO